MSASADPPASLAPETVPAPPGGTRTDDGVPVRAPGAWRGRGSGNRIEEATDDIIPSFDVPQPSRIRFGNPAVDAPSSSPHDDSSILTLWFLWQMGLLPTTSSSLYHPIALPAPPKPSAVYSREYAVAPDGTASVEQTPLSVYDAGSPASRGSKGSSASTLTGGFPTPTGPGVNPYPAPAAMDEGLWDVPAVARQRWGRR